MNDSAEPVATTATTPEKKPKREVWNLGFISLIIAQFFGAMNDNVLKGVLTFMVIDGAWQGSLGKGGQGIVGMCFTIPFILLSGYGGQLADRYSKRAVTWWVKAIEIPIAIVAGIGFWTGNLFLTLFALIALTCQSSFFGPAKYGMIPELVGDRLLSKANGSINMMTNLAVILGTLLAGFVSDRYSPQGDSIPQLWWPITALVLIAACGFAVALLMPKLPVGEKGLKFDWNPFSTYFATIAEMSASKLLMVMMAWGYFYLLAGIALFILPEYTVVLKINRTEASVLMGVLGISVGIGCALAGWISGNQIRPRLIPLGAFGLVIFFALLGLTTPTLGGVADAAQANANVMPVRDMQEPGGAGVQEPGGVEAKEPGGMEAKEPGGVGMKAVATSNVALFVFGAGLSAGFYIIPLQALLQKWSPDDERGRFLGTANAVSFAFLTIAAALYWSIAGFFGDSPHRMFVLCAILMAAGAGFFLWRLRGTRMDAV
ncbi:MAG: MFS transporter [Planctomycetota bacterium]